jgi:hypothetical protein
MTTRLPRLSPAATASFRTRVGAWALGLLTLWAACDSGVALAACPLASPPAPLPAPQDDDDMMRPEAAAAHAPRRTPDDRPAAPPQALTLFPSARAAVHLSATLPSFDRRNGVGAPLRC